MERERVGRFLRALVGLFTVATAVVAVVSPGRPLVFTVLLVVAWVLAAPAAAWLVFRDGYATLRSSGLYAPRAPASRAAATFAGLTLLLKALLTLGADVLLGEAAVGDPEGSVAGAFAVVIAYAVVFLAGGLGAVQR